MHENYHQVVQQMEDFGVVFRNTDLPLRIDEPKRRTTGRGGKWWYWLRTFAPTNGRPYVVGAFGSYKTGERLKVEVDWRPLADEERARLRAERKAAEERAALERKRDAELAALSAHELWHRAAREGRSEYLTRKRVEPEACRYLPDGSILIPLLRYDRPRAAALVGLQRIWGKPRVHGRTGEALPGKTFTKGFQKTGACLRLGQVNAGDVLLVGEGYATCLSVRMATERQYPVFVALDAGNLLPVCELLRTLHPDERLLICADDDWRTAGNPGRSKALQAAKALERCDIVWPSFVGLPRGDKDTDFNDLHLLGGLGRVQAQLRATLDGIRRFRSAAA